MIRVLAFLLLCLSACAPAPLDTGPKRIGDRDPVAFSGRSPQSFPIRGVDVARFQQTADFRTARAKGITFAFIKATEGGDLKDPMFTTHWRNAGRAGVARGAYHFYYFCTAPEVQAAWFIRNVPRRRGDLPPVLDMEWNPLSPSCRRRPDAGTIQAEMRIWLNRVEAHYGTRPIIYTTPGFYEDAELADMRGETFWLRSTAKSLTEAYPGQPWRFWQYTATGIVPGIPGDVDINVFNGSAEVWDNWRAAKSQ